MLELLGGRGLESATVEVPEKHVKEGHERREHGAEGVDARVPAQEWLRTQETDEVVERSSSRRGPDVPPLASVASGPGIAATGSLRKYDMDGDGRVLVRPSGTEPLVRVMVEAPSAEACEEYVERIAAVVREEMGMKSIS